MNETRQKWDLWKLPTLLLWLAFFGVGLAPTLFYSTLRDFSGVLPQNALVNSPHMITIALAGYMAIFVFNRCLAAGATVPEAQDKAIQVGIFAWVAFLPLDFVDVIMAYANPLVRNRTIVYFAAAMKLTAWWLLLVMILRYYLTRETTLFPGVVGPFPNANQANKNQENAPKDTIPIPVSKHKEDLLPDFIPDVPQPTETSPMNPTKPPESQGRGESEGSFSE